MTSARGIAFDYRPSAALTRGAAALVVLAALAVACTGLPPGARLGGAVLVAATGAWRVAVFRRPRILALAWASDGVWTVTLADGRAMGADLRAFRVMGRAAFLTLRWQGGGADIALLPDNAPADELRLLRARLGSAAR